MNVPVIQSIGPPPERHAARVVAEMCRWLFGEEQNFKAATREAAKMRRSRLGSPKAQLRFCERLRKAGGDGLVASYLAAGKRGRFLMGFVVWRVVKPFSLDVLREGDAFPDKPWLTCEMVRIEGPEGKLDQCVHLAVTHHALQRLAECGQVREPKHLIYVLRKLWKGVYPTDKLRDKDELLVKIPLANGLAICTREEPGMEFVVKTVLRPGMFELEQEKADAE